MPLSHLRPGMHVLVDDGEGGLVPDRVDEVDTVAYDGPVYDLEVDGTHNFVADNVCVRNSIYKFRGADMRNILEFENAFPDVTIVVLEQNYRSTQTILDAANAVIANNLSRKPKELWTDRGDGNPIVRYHADDEVDEAQWVTREVAKLHDGGDMRWADIAVFYRTNAQSRVVEENLTRMGVPYKVIGGTRFYDRREVKDALAYLKAVINPTDEVSVKRILNTPKRGIGDGSVGKLDAYASGRGLSFMDALRRSADAGVSGTAVKGIAAFLELLDSVAELAAADEPAPLLQALLDRSGYLIELQEERTIEAEGRLENLAELVGSAEDAESIDVFLEQVSLVSDPDEIDGDDSQVVLMTDPRRQGPRVPGRVHHGAGGGRVPPPALDRRARRAGGGAAPRLRRHHPRPGAPLPEPRVEPHALRRHAVQPAEPLPRRDPRAARRGDRAEAGQPRRPHLRQRWLRLRVEGRRRRRQQGPHRRGGHALERARAARPAPRRSGIKTGDDVVHAKWGEGVILQIRGRGRQDRGGHQLPERRREGPAAVLGADQEGLTAVRVSRRVGDQTSGRRRGRPCWARCRASGERRRMPWLPTTDEVGRRPRRPPSASRVGRVAGDARGSCVGDRGCAAWIDGERRASASSRGLAASARAAPVERRHQVRARPP